MTVVETLLVYVVAPVVLYFAVWGWIAVRSRSGRSRNTAGDAWPYEPLFWIANPAGAAHDAAHASADGSDARGGTGGTW